MQKPMSFKEAIAAVQALVLDQTGFELPEDQTRKLLEIGYSIVEPWEQFHNAEVYFPAKPGLYCCQWEGITDKNTWEAGFYFNYWTGKRWVTGNKIAKDAVKAVPANGAHVPPSTYVNERKLKLVRWSPVRDDWQALVEETLKGLS